MAPSKSLLEDIFEVLEVDPDGKKFDKGALYQFDKEILNTFTMLYALIAYRQIPNDKSNFSVRNSLI
jgi:hypothetical protein